MAEVNQPTAVRPSSPDSDSIVGALRDAGWLLEQDTVRTLIDAGFRTTPGMAFQDPDRPSDSREIDVVGTRTLHFDDDLQLQVETRVIIECKHSSMPYVLVGFPNHSSQTPVAGKEQRLRFDFVEDAAGGQVPAPAYLGLDRLPHNPWTPRFMATQMTRLHRKNGAWRADNEGIFPSLIHPLAKAVTHFRAQPPHPKNYEHLPADGARVAFYYPIVVTSGELYTVDVERNPLEAIPARWATMSREIQTATVQGRFRIDVVTSEALPDHLSQINEFSDAVAALVRADPRKFVTHRDDDY